MGMSFYLVNLSDLWVLVAKKMQEKKRKYRILIFWASFVGEENEEHMFWVLRVLPKKYFNLTIFFSFPFFLKK